MTEDDIKAVRGWIAPRVSAITDFFHHCVPKDMGTRTDGQKYFDTPGYTAGRAARTDTFVWRCLLMDIVTYLAISAVQLVEAGTCQKAVITSIACLIIVPVLAWQLSNIMATAFRISLFDAWFNAPDITPKVASYPRIVILGLINFVQMMLIFGAFYAIDPDRISMPKDLTADWLDPLYLSCIAQTTIGFGDRHPEGWLRAVAMVQSLCVFSFLVVFLSRAVSVLPRIESIEETMWRQHAANTLKEERESELEAGATRHE